MFAQMTPMEQLQSIAESAVWAHFEGCSEWQGVKETLESWHLIQLANAVSKVTRLYEQGASDERIGEYWTRFLRWLQAGISDDIPRPALPLSYFCAMDDQSLLPYHLMFLENFSTLKNLQNQLTGIPASHNTMPSQKYFYRFAVKIKLLNG